MGNGEEGGVGPQIRVCGAVASGEDRAGGYRRRLHAGLFGWIGVNVLSVGFPGVVRRRAVVREVFIFSSRSGWEWSSKK